MVATPITIHYHLHAQCKLRGVYQTGHGYRQWEYAAIHISDEIFTLQVSCPPLQTIGLGVNCLLKLNGDNFIFKVSSK